MGGFSSSWPYPDFLLWCQSFDKPKPKHQPNQAKSSRTLGWSFLYHHNVTPCPCLCPSLSHGKYLEQAQLAREEMAPIQGVKNFMVKIYWTKKGLKITSQGIIMNGYKFPMLKSLIGWKCAKVLLQIMSNVFREINFWVWLKSIGW